MKSALQSPYDRARRMREGEERRRVEEDIGRVGGVSRLSELF